MVKALSFTGSGFPQYSDVDKPYAASFTERNATNSAAGYALGDGVDWWMAGQHYLNDYSKTGTDSCLNDLGQDGVVPFGQVSSEHTGGDISAATAFGPVAVVTDANAAPLTLGVNGSLEGSGRRSGTSLTFAAGVGTAIDTPDSSTARNKIEGMAIYSDGLTQTSGDVGIDAGDSSFGVWSDYSLWGFDVGFIDNETLGTSSFSARNIHFAYEVNLCNTGYLHHGANANSWFGGRVWNCDIGHDIEDAEALSFFGENTESCALAYKIRDSYQVNLFGGYIEAGAGANEAFDLDAESMVGLYGVKINGKRGNLEQWNPNKSEWHFDARDTNQGLTRMTFLSDASKQYIKNSDFSLALAEGWLTSAVTATLDTGAFESGTRSLKLVPSGVGGYVRQVFSVERDVAALSLGVRIMPMGDQTLRVYISDGTSSNNPAWTIPAYSAWATATAYVKGDVVTDGGYSYRATEDHTSGATFAGDAAKWEENWLTYTPKFDVEDSSANIDVRVYPDVIGGTGIAYVDQVWVVRGKFISAPRRYDQRQIFLDTPITLASGAVTANTNAAYTLAGAGADIPTGAVGYIVRLGCEGTNADTYACAANLFTNDLAVHPRVDNVKAASDFTIMGLDGDTVQVLVGSSSHTVTYEAKLIGWIVE